MSSTQRVLKNMKEAGGKIPGEFKRTPKFTPTDQKLRYSTYESDDISFVHATPTNRLWEEIYQFDGTEHHAGKIFHNDMTIETQPMLNDTMYELGQHHADTFNTMPDNRNVIARNKNNSFEQLDTISIPAHTVPEGSHNVLRNLHDEEQMYFDDQLEVPNSNVGFANTRGGQVILNKASYDDNHSTGQSEGRMQAVEMYNQQISRTFDQLFPLGPLAEEDLSEFPTMAQEEYEDINRLINGSFDESSKSVPELTEADQAFLDAMGTENSESSLTRYPYQPSFSGNSFQDVLFPTAQDPTIQNNDCLQETGTIYYPLQHGAGCPGLPKDEPVPSHHSPKKSATMPYPLAAMVGLTTMKISTDNDHPTHYLEGSLSPMCADQQLPINNNGQITDNYRPSAPLLRPGIHRPLPDVDFQHLSASPNVAEAAQNTFEHDQLYHKPENCGYNGAVPFHANDIGAYPTPPYDSYTPAESQYPEPAMTHYAENSFGAGGEMQQTYYRPMNAENSVLHRPKNGVPGKNGERNQNGENVPRSKKRPNWAMRPDAFRPRVSMTEEEYQWLRPEKPARDIFTTARRKADDKRMREEAMADAMERAGKPRPKPKTPMPIKGGVHIEEWEKEKLNDYRKSRGLSGRSLFMAKPKKRKAREVAGPDSQQEPKKQRLSENGDHGFGTMNGVNKNMSDGELRTDTGTMSGYPSMEKGKGTKVEPAPTLHTQHNQNKYVSVLNGQSGQISGDGGSTPRVPRSPHAWPVQNNIDPQLQPPRRPQICGSIVSPWNKLDPAYGSMENGVNGTSSGLAMGDGPVSWFPDSTDFLNRGKENLQDFNNLIDPRLLSGSIPSHLEKLAHQREVMAATTTPT